MAATRLIALHVNKGRSVAACLEARTDYAKNPEKTETAYNENSPEFIYFMMLYNVFSEFLDDVSEDVLPNEATGFKQSKIWSMLYDFQKDAVLPLLILRQ